RIAAVRQDLEALNQSLTVYTGTFSAPEPAFLLHRGDPMQKRGPVEPAVLSEIGSRFEIPSKASDPQRRAALAEWITRTDNPLAARVIANRLWQHHFGTGIVDTPSDFGRNGAKPTHPELLDWLAAELVAPSFKFGESCGRSPRPWSLKHIHRVIVTSATYRQSSAMSATGREKDAQSRLLWRYPPQRLEAEVLRDSILFVSGKLDAKMGGPGFDLFEPNTNYVHVYAPKNEFGPAEFRRMIYQMKPRMQLDDTFGAFDCPDAGQIAPKRNVSTTPLQSLNLLNSAFMVQQAGYFADRVKKHGGSDIPAQVKRAFLLAFQREPTPKEQTAAEDLVREHGLPALCRALFNANEFVFVE
ncbi:MAG TPA: DUF1553 domain-containing protein, partial [Gemmata sp.]|nr:DUF1553 domain-containing protein [Gemmata sp.]